MTKVIIVVRGGLVESVFTRNKNINVEIIDLDVDGDYEAERIAKKRLAEVENSKSYKRLG